ncbi:hypothetical protein MHZ90_14335 [Pantoea sp. ACRSH]|uniref:hypothetical protein n=1 Tax=unclassified Pantoea TaxID=2630326 RepID=UPI001EF3D88C|nr:MULTISPECIES: hypothetical protein [unclassified Pantoea]MCG7367299.1 hypothetical protein [Pantoea sp. ACRSH]MCG7397592.1 hypothetical protein [Pantoea sp. ACRSC]
MTTLSSPIPLSTPSEQALAYFTAKLNRDHVTLMRDFKWTLEECQALDVEQQDHAANKLLAAGNILNRKTPQPVAAPVKAESPMGNTDQPDTDSDVTTSTSVTTATPSARTKPLFFTSVATAQNHLVAQRAAAAKAVA